MAKFILAAALLTMTTAAAHAETPEPDAETVALAAEAGVDSLNLLGAVLTTHMDPRAYLLAVGDLAAPVPVAPAYSVWDRVAACESHGNWAANTGNGYYGGLQFDLPSWRAAGGVGMPNQASRATQIAVAERWLAMTSWRSWPACSRLLGLR
ncbi:MAG: hypothetical protein NVS4B6_22670 [Mycobacterium sp.]